MGKFLVPTPKIMLDLPVYIIYYINLNFIQSMFVLNNKELVKTQPEAC